MDKYDEYLKKEAEYQDSKIVNSPRRNIGKVYHDASSRFRSLERDAAIGDIADKKVLDVGCGNGDAAMKALRSGAYVTAIDISPKSVEYLTACAREESLDHRLTALVMDAHKLAFDDDTFDVVYGDGILHHLPMLETAVSEIRRVLKPSGYAVFLEPLGMNPFLKVFRIATPKLRTADEQPFRRKELNIVKGVFPEVQFRFFDCTTLLAKIPLLMGLSKFSDAAQRKLIKLDNVLIRSAKSTKITFLQKMSWIVLAKMPK